MDEGMRAALSAGASVVYDGQAWEVAELSPPSVLLAGASGELRRVSISHLLAAPGTRVSGSRDRDGGLDAGTVLSGLDDAELARLRERVAHVREVCTGYRRGSPDLALPGEPRPGALSDAFSASAPRSLRAAGPAQRACTQPDLQRS